MYPNAVRARAELELRRRGARGEAVGQTLPELLPHFTEKERAFFQRSRFKALYGGRAGRKSHTFAELMLARMVLDPALQCVVIRKYRASLTYSAKLLLENKIRALGWDSLFDIQGNTIRRTGGTGFIAFTGMQDHNATSIKSYENFGIAWPEEATEIDQFSLDLLVPTLRAPGSELWFSWNPDQPTDPVDSMFRVSPPQNAVIQEVSFRDNVFLTEESKQDEQDALARDPEKHNWIWLGGYNVASNQIIFAGRWRVGEVDTTGWDGPYYGGDFGFSSDPTAAIKLWRAGNQIHAEYESYAYGLQIDHIAGRWIKDVPMIERNVSRGDNSRPDTIRYLQGHGLPKCIGAPKGPGSVESGVEWLRSHEIIVHPRCENLIDELKRYRYKTNKAGDVLADIEDKDNHLIDSIRYAMEPLIRSHGRQYGESRARW